MKRHEYSERTKLRIELITGLIIFVIGIIDNYKSKKRIDKGAKMMVDVLKRGTNLYD